MNRFKILTFDDLVDNFFGVVNNVIDDITVKSNVKELENKYQLDIIVPGYRKDEISIDASNGVLTIEATIKEDDKEEKYVRLGHKKQSFKKQYQIPEDVNVENIKASQNDGILTIELFKYENKQTSKKTINID